MPKITKIQATVPTLPTKKRVAAYARVSIERGRTIHSLSAQISYYSNYIQSRSEWEYAGVYADSGESGTGKNRAEFTRLIADCEADKIDIVLTKSISRFARNTVDLLETVRKLKELSIAVIFEEQNINSMSGDGELMLTILASFAQEESRSLSENVKWAIRKRFKEGKPNSFIIYGYRWNGEKFIIEPTEAAVVRLIYANYLKGMSAKQTQTQLKEMGVKSYTGMDGLPAESIRAILRNEKYTGVLKLQKCYIENHITHKEMKNKGELPIYLVENAHEAIIDKATFEAVQAEQAKRRELRGLNKRSANKTAFRSKIKCGNCGATFHRKGRKRVDGSTFQTWHCSTNSTKGKTYCPMLDVPEDKIKEATCEILELNEFDREVFAAKITGITVSERFKLIFYTANGKEIYKSWENTTKGNLQKLCFCVIF